MNFFFKNLKKIIRFKFYLVIKILKFLYASCQIPLIIFRRVKNSLYLKSKNFIYIYCYNYLINLRKIKNSLFFCDLFIRKKLLFINQKFSNKNKFIKKNNSKIILVISSLSRGGAERQVLKLAENLIKKKLKCKIVSIVKLKKDLTYYVPKHIHVDYLNRKKFNITDCNDREFLNDLKKLNFFSIFEKESILGLYNYLKKEDPDIVHAFLDFPCIISGYISLYLNIRKVILSTRNVSPNHFLLFRSYFREFYKLLLKYKKIILVNNSKAGARSYEMWLNIKKNSIKTSYNIFNFDQKIKLKKIKKKINSINFVSIIRLDPEKNPEYILKLAKNLIQQNSNYYFYIIGTGFLKKKLEKFIKKNQLSKNIKLLGIKENIFDYLNFADYTLLTSKEEGTPNVLLESQKVGTPVITTNSGGSKETFIRNYSGHLLEKKSIKKDCDIIHNIVRTTINKKLDLKIIKKKLNKFSHFNSVQQTLKLYK